MAMTPASVSKAIDGNGRVSILREECYRKFHSPGDRSRT